MDEKFLKQLKTVITEVIDEKLEQKLDEKLKPLHGEIALLKKSIRDIDMQSMKLSLQADTHSKDLARIESKVEQLQQSTDSVISDISDLQSKNDATYDLVKIVYEKMGDWQQEIKTIKKHISLPTTL